MKMTKTKNPNLLDLKLFFCWIILEPIDFCRKQRTFYLYVNILLVVRSPQWLLGELQPVVPFLDDLQSGSQYRKNINLRQNMFFGISLKMS